MYIIRIHLCISEGTSALYLNGVMSTLLRDSRTDQMRATTWDIPYIVPA